MAVEPISKELMLRYALGDVNDAELSRVETACFANSAVLDEVWAVFDDLAEDYLRGKLTAERTASFERRLETAPALRQRFEEQRDLMRSIARRSSTQASAPAARAPAGWLERHFNFTTFRWGWAGTMAALFLAGGVWLFKEFSRTTPPNPGDVATLTPTPTLSPIVPPTPSSSTLPSPPPAASPERHPVLASFLLSAGLLREGNKPPTLPISSAAQTLQLELELIPPISPRYQAELATSGGEKIQDWPSLRPVSQAASSVIRLRLPAGKVAAGEYILTLIGRNAAGEVSTPGKYRFIIERH